MPRTAIKELSIAVVFDRIEKKLSARIAEKGDQSWASRHEIESIVRCECDELSQAIRCHAPTFEIERELIDIAVAAVFGLACIGQATLDW